MIIFYIQ